MKYIKLMTVSMLLFVTGCANQAAKDYYAAMEKAAAAQAVQQEARYRALATVAQNGDPASKAAATMAIALTQDKVVAPQYVEDQALKWAGVLAPSITTLGAVYWQTDLAKHQSDNMKDIQIASYASNEAIQLGQQGMLVDALSVNAGATSEAVAGLVTLGTAGFDALNVAGAQTTEVAVNAQDGLVDLGSVGIITTGAVGVAGLSTAESISINAQNSLVDLGTVGMTSLVDLGVHGFDSMNVLNDTNSTTLTSITSQYNQTIQDMNAVIESISANNPSICVVDPVAGTTCN